MKFILFFNSILEFKTAASRGSLQLAGAKAKRDYIYYCCLSPYLLCTPSPLLPFPPCPLIFLFSPALGQGAVRPLRPTANAIDPRQSHSAKTGFHATSGTQGASMPLEGMGEDPQQEVVASFDCDCFTS